MFLKVVVLFLLVMMLIGMVGKLTGSGAKTKPLARKCPTCGSFVIGKGPCKNCAKKGR